MGFPAATADGIRIRLEANVEFPDDMAAARYAGADGIGLYRTEFQLSTGAGDIENEDRQYEIYRGMLEGMAPGSVTVRTFDVFVGASRSCRGPSGEPCRVTSMAESMVRRPLCRCEAHHPREPSQFSWRGSD